MTDHRTVSAGIPLTSIPRLTPGTRVRVVQQIDRREGDWHCEVSGTVVRVEVRPTGSWFVGQPAGRYPLTRLTLRKDDGELSVISLDEDSRVVVLPNV